MNENPCLYYEIHMLIELTILKMSPKLLHNVIWKALRPRLMILPMVLFTKHWVQL